MQLEANEVCKLDKSAYGLIDAPYLRFQTLCSELKQLGMEPSQFDPCVCILRNPKMKTLSGILGVYVDDGIYGGDEYFKEQILKLEASRTKGVKIISIHRNRHATTT